MVIVTDEFGCSVRAEIFMNSLILRYQIFPPNGDGLNERWRIANINQFPNIMVKIHEYGEVLYEFKLMNS